MTSQLQFRNTSEKLNHNILWTLLFIILFIIAFTNRNIWFMFIFGFLSSSKIIKTVYLYNKKISLIEFDEETIKVLIKKKYVFPTKIKAYIDKKTNNIYRLKLDNRTYDFATSNDKELLHLIKERNIEYIERTNWFLISLDFIEIINPK